MEYCQGVFTVKYWCRLKSNRVLTIHMYGGVEFVVIVKLRINVLSKYYG